MAKGNEAADAIRREIKRVEQLRIAADILDRYGSLETALSEAKKAFDTAQQESEHARRSVEAVKAQYAADEELHNERLKQHSEELRELKTTANTEATGIKVSARESAQKLIERARDKARQIEDETNQYLLSVSEKRGNLINDVDTLENTKAGLQSEIKALEVKLARIQKTLSGMMSASDSLDSGGQ